MQPIEDDKLGDWYAEFGHVRRFDVVQMSDTSMGCIIILQILFQYVDNIHVKIKFVDTIFEYSINVF